MRSGPSTVVLLVMDSKSETGPHTNKYIKALSSDDAKRSQVSLHGIKFTLILFRNHDGGIENQFNQFLHLLVI